MPPTPADVEGLRIEVGPYRIEWSQMGLAHSLIWSTSELHTRASRTDRGVTRPPLATGPWVAAVIAGLYAKSDVITELRTRGVVLQALLDLDITYRGAIYGGDEIWADCVVQSCEEAEDGMTGVIVVADECIDSSRRKLLSCLRTYRYTRAAE
jgi:hypothetical protein